MTMQLLDPPETIAEESAARPPNWVVNARVLWEHRRTLARATMIALLASVAVAFLIPKRYTSTGRIMPPENSGTGSAVLAALAGRSLPELGGLSALAGGLLGGRNTSALFVDLLRSGTVSGRLVDRFHLQQTWHKRYRSDAAKYLARHTTIAADKMSGVITVEVVDSDPRRVRDLAQAYLDELNVLVNRTNTSSARQERIFIEHRLQGVEADLERAQRDLSQFASTHTTIDLPEQTRAMVEAAARLQAEQIVQQSEVDSLRQIYGNANVRVRAADARVADLRKELIKMSGTSAPLPPGDPVSAGADSPAREISGEVYPPLRQLPRLGVPYADLYRRLRVQESVYELLTQQYEIARVEEARDVPVVNVIDTPGIPDKKSFPPRIIVAVLLTVVALGATVTFILFRHRWELLDPAEPRRVLAQDVATTLRRSLRRHPAGSADSGERA